MKYVAVSVLILLVVAASCSLREAQLKKEGEAVIAKIDDFNTKNRRLPESLSEIGIKEREEGPIYYQKTGESKYIVWYGATLGESVTFDSSTRRWTP